jgi:hypothetical protein
MAWVRTARMMSVVSTLVVAAVIVAGFCLIIDDYWSKQFHAEVWFTVLASVLGMVLAGSEILSRFRDQPVRAALSQPGIIYLLVNALISALVYGLLVRFEASLIPAIKTDHLLGAIIAGLGAMAILRSKFFAFQTQAGDNISIGPDVIATAYLDTANRSIDRERAVSRLSLVFSLTKDRVPPADAESALVLSLGSFQNLSKDELKDVKDQIAATYADVGLNELQKFQAVCFGLVNLGGERVLRQVVTNILS